MPLILLVLSYYPIVEIIYYIWYYLRLMEQQQRSLVFTAAVGLIILAIIIGSVYYLVKFIQGRVATSRQTPQTSHSIAQNSEATNSGDILTPGIITDPQTPSQNSTGDNQASDKKVYNAGNLQLVYPNSWGALTCDNSLNVEFDPTNPADARVSCGTASKPLTVLIGEVGGCEGETSKIGNTDVVKSQATEGSYTKYQWCTKTTPVLNITHRVSQDGEPATSKQDYSRQVEEMISTLSFTSGS